MQGSIRALLVLAIALGQCRQKLLTAAEQQHQQQGPLLGRQLAQTAFRGPTYFNQPNLRQEPRDACARPGYVFVECQEPAAALADPGLNSNPSYLRSASIDEIQDECDYFSNCVAFSTGGVLYAASPKTGKVGPLKPIRMCFIGTLGRGQRHNQCKGTYVFDGTLKQRAVVVSAGSTSSTGQGGNMTATVTSVPTKVMQQYVRAKATGGTGRVGVTQCSLC